MPHLELDVIIDAPVETVWGVVVDWERQGEWMLGTDVTVVSGDGRSAGSALAAWTGLRRPFGFLDTMTITHWDPPRRCDVLHTGSVVKGTGRFDVLALPGERSRFVWQEDLELPLGVLGQAGWPLARPPFVLGVKRSLQALARLAEAEHRAHSRS